MADDTGAPAPEPEVVTTDAGAPEAPVAVSEAPKDGGTLLGTEPVEKPVAAPATWPDDWRVKIAGDDAKELARLQRMGSPADLYKSYRALEAKLQEKSGPPKLAPPEGATPEQVAEWRKEMGIPDAPEGYQAALPNGIVPGEMDKPLIDGFQKVALDANMTTAQFNKALEWYYAQQDNLRVQQEEVDTTYRRDTEDTLRTEWGGEYRFNLNAVNNALKLYFGDEASEILSARTPSGKLLGDYAPFIKGMALNARETNPALPHIPAGSSNPLQATQNRISEIQRMMREEPQRYWKDESVQAEFRDLLAAQEKYGGRAA